MVRPTTANMLFENTHNFFGSANWHYRLHAVTFSHRLANTMNPRARVSVQNCAKSRLSPLIRNGEGMHSDSASCIWYCSAVYDMHTGMGISPYRNFPTNERQRVLLERTSHEERPAYSAGAHICIDYGSIHIEGSCVVEACISKRLRVVRCCSESPRQCW